MPTVDVALKILDPRLGDSIPLPHAATAGSAGMDLRAALDAPLVLQPGDTAHGARRGFAIHIGDPRLVRFDRAALGAGAQTWPGDGQSGRRDRRRLPGPADDLLLEPWLRRHTPSRVGDRIAQLLLVPVAQARLRVVSDFAPSERGDGGFGSTGIK